MPENEIRPDAASTPQVVTPTAPVPVVDDVEALRQRADRAERENVLRRALSGVDWFDADDAYRELSRHAERNEQGEWEIFIPGDAPNSARKTVPPDEAARQLASRKPHWVRAHFIAGSGSNGIGNGAASASGAPAGLNYTDLLKPENADRLRDYVHNRPRELERMRQSYFK
ncbi:MAG: hypothetical protein WCT04_20030 [Planctomycetota bacterium]